MGASDYVYARTAIDGADVPYKNTSGVAITAGQVLKLDTGNTESGTQPIKGMIPTSAVTDKPRGVALENVAIGGTGRCQTAGEAVVIASGAIAVNQSVGPSATAGQVAVFTSGDPQLGVAITAAAQAGDQIRIQLQISNQNT